MSARNGSLVSRLRLDTKRDVDFHFFANLLLMLEHLCLSYVIYCDLCTERFDIISTLQLEMQIYLILLI